MGPPTRSRDFVGRGTDLQSARLRIPERHHRAGRKPRIEKPLPLGARGVGRVEIEAVVAILLGEQPLEDKVFRNRETRPAERRKQSVDVGSALLARFAREGTGSVEKKVAACRAVAG